MLGETGTKEECQLMLGQEGKRTSIEASGIGMWESVKSERRRHIDNVNNVYQYYIGESSLYFAILYIGIGTKNLL